MTPTDGGTLKNTCRTPASPTRKPSPPLIRSRSQKATANITTRYATTTVVNTSRVSHSVCKAGCFLRALDRKSHHVVNRIATDSDEEQSIESDRHTGTVRQPGTQRREKPLT